jgi:Ni/Co efflux regulator RcnB
LPKNSKATILALLYSTNLKMKKVITLALGILFVSTPICLSQAAVANANTERVEQTDTKKMGAKPKAPKKMKRMSKKKASTSRCMKPTDRDSKGRLCGKRAASERKGGN